MLIEDWRIDYNHHRPHSALGMMAPAVFAASLRPPLPPSTATASGEGGDQGQLLPIAGGAPQPSIFPAGRQQSPAEEITTQHTNRRGSYRGATMWRAGLRIGEALELAETDLDASRGAVLVRRGKGGRRPEVGMDRWAWSQLDAWLALRTELPVGALLCVVRGATAGRPWDVSSARKQLARTAAQAGVRRRFAPHQLRHAHAVEMAHEGVPLVVIQRQLGHAKLGVTSIYRQGIDSSEIVNTVHSRPAPVISASAGLTATV